MNERPHRRQDHELRETRGDKQTDGRTDGRTDREIVVRSFLPCLLSAPLLPVSVSFSPSTLLRAAIERRSGRRAMNGSSSNTATRAAEKGKFDKERPRFRGRPFARLTVRGLRVRLHQDPLRERPGHLVIDAQNASLRTVKSSSIRPRNRVELVVLLLLLLMSPPPPSPPPPLPPPPPPPPPSSAV